MRLTAKRWASTQCSRTRWTTRQPYGCLARSRHLPSKASTMNWMCASMPPFDMTSTHFCTTWLPFWSATHSTTLPRNSRTTGTSSARSMVSSAFCTTRQPYMWLLSSSTWPSIVSSSATLQARANAHERKQRVERERGKAWGGRWERRVATLKITFKVPSRTKKGPGHQQGVTRMLGDPCSISFCTT